MAENTTGQGRNKLGFGYMRVPHVNGVFDYESVNAMVDRFIELGFTYFDSANEYLGSELALGKSLVARYPRDSYWFSSKMNILRMTESKQLRQMFDKTLQRTGAEYLDAYFIHILSPPLFELADKLGVWEFLRSLKERGMIKHIGTSYHGPPEKLDELLAAHPEIDIILSMINYVDWANPDFLGRDVYEVIKKHGKQVTVIEPCKGGLLATENTEAAKVLKAANPDVSAASWAFRFVLGFDNIKAVLSGMGTIAQVEDNAKTFNNYTPFTDAEQRALDEAIKLIRNQPRIPCTSCGQCAPHCPVKIAIPFMIGLWSDHLVYLDKEGPGYLIGYMKTHGSGSPVECTKCGACEAHCPENIPIMEIMESMEKTLGETSRKYVQITKKIENYEVES